LKSLVLLGVQNSDFTPQLILYSAFAKHENTATTMMLHGIYLKKFIILAFTEKYNEFWHRERERKINIGHVKTGLPHVLYLIVLLQHLKM